MIAQISMALWLSMVITISIGGALNPHKPRLFVLDQYGQSKVLWGMAAGGAVEALTLWLGGFWG